MGWRGVVGCFGVALGLAACGAGSGLDGEPDASGDTGQPISDSLGGEATTSTTDGSGQEETTGATTGGVETGSGVDERTTGSVEATGVTQGGGTVSGAETLGSSGETVWESGSETGAASSSSGTAGAEESVCDRLPGSAVTITGHGLPFVGADDLATGPGGVLIAARLNELVELHADGSEVVVLNPVGSRVLGIETTPWNTVLFVHAFGDTIVEVEGGVASVYVPDAPWLAPSGLSIDGDGSVWLTDFVGDSVYRINPDRTVDLIANDMDQANGVFFDEERRILYWTLSTSSTVYRSPIDASGAAAAPLQVAELEGASAGVTMDACGNLYVVDQGRGQGCRIDRLYLDESGAVDTSMGTAGVEEIAAAGSLSLDCAGIEFGYGFGDGRDESVFVVNPLGQLHQVELGVEGRGYPQRQ